MGIDQPKAVLQQAIELTNNSLIKYEDFLQSVKNDELQKIVENIVDKKQAQLALLNKINSTIEKGNDIKDLLSAGSFGDLTGRSDLNNLNQLIESEMDVLHTDNAPKQRRKNSAKTNECKNCKHYQYCKAMNKLMD
jgi:hypothetical protein